MQYGNPFICSLWLAYSQIKNKKRIGIVVHNMRPWKQRIWMAYRLYLCGWALYYPKGMCAKLLLRGKNV